MRNSNDIKYLNIDTTRIHSIGGKELAPPLPFLFMFEPVR